MEMYIVLAVTLFMMIMFVWHKIPFGVTTMTCCMILAATGVVKLSVAFTGFGNKIVVLIAPMLALSAALTKTSLVARLVFSCATVIMTTFLSNAATQAVLTPIAASICLAGGWDPRGVVLIIATANMFAIGFPSGSGEAAVAYAAGGYNPVKVLRFTVPYMLLAILICAVTAEVMYPLY